MDEFLVIARAENKSDFIDIFSVTQTAVGYLLAVNYSYTDGSFTQRALYLVRDEMRGKYRLGWSNILHEHIVEEE